MIDDKLLIALGVLNTAHAAAFGALAEVLIENGLIEKGALIERLQEASKDAAASDAGQPAAALVDALIELVKRIASLPSPEMPPRAH